MQTQTSANAKGTGTGTGIGKGFPKSADNPDGYTMKENDRRLPPKATPSKRGNGRKDHEGTPEIIQFESITKGCSEMMRAYMKIKQAQDHYNDVCKAVAERSHVKVKTLKKLVRSSAKGNYEEVKDEIEQEQEVFEIIGEIGGGKESEAA